MNSFATHNTMAHAATAGGAHSPLPGFMLTLAHATEAVVGWTSHTLMSLTGTASGSFGFGALAAAAVLWVLVTLLVKVGARANYVFARSRPEVAYSLQMNGCGVLMKTPIVRARYSTNTYGEGGLDSLIKGLMFAGAAAVLFIGWHTVGHTIGSADYQGITSSVSQVLGNHGASLASTNLP